MRKLDTQNNSGFKRLNNGWGIQPMGPSPLDTGDMHDTFKVDPLGNISGGHTTIRIPDGQEIQMPWQQPLQQR